MTKRFEVEVCARNQADANKLTNELETVLRTAAPDVEVSRLKNSNQTMDTGTILQIVFGSSATTAIGHGIAAWLAKRPTGSIIIRKNGDIVGRGLKSSDILRVAEIFASK